jgi:pimeloyl-ACP methyl ester carboxylesterase
MTTSTTGSSSTAVAVRGEPDEVRALTRLAFEELSGIPAGIGGIHMAVADRVFRWVGPAAAPARVVHDAVTGGVYGALRSGTHLLGRGVDGAAFALRGPVQAQPVSTTRRGSLAVGILNGLRGDTFERAGSPLHQPMAVRVEGGPVELERDALATAFPAATPRLAVFLHGLMETEFSWRLGARGEEDTYGARLASELGCTPVYVRYNSGRHISENGRSLAELLAGLVDEWPVGVGEIALVGHSMGGLVSRSACHQGVLERMAWTRHVRHVVSLGSPHMGAPLEQGVHYLSAALNALPETRPFGAFLRRRSAGIRDLRQGSLVDEDWRDRDPDALRAVACQEVPLLENATHCFVAGTITRSAKHPLGRLVGDFLVLEPSASGRSRTRRIPFKSEHGMHVGGVNHFALLNHSAIYERLRGWLETPPAQLAAGSAIEGA